MEPAGQRRGLCVDEKTMIQALDRTQPGLPIKPGKGGTMTHDYKRNGTVDLYAALDILSGEVVGQCTARHRHQEFMSFLRKLDREFPKPLDLHVVLDNSSTHSHPNVRAWLDAHPRFHLHFAPTSSSWLNMVEGVFADVTKRRLRRGAFASVDDLVKAIISYLEHPTRTLGPLSGRPQWPPSWRSCGIVQLPLRRSTSRVSPSAISVVVRPRGGDVGDVDADVSRGIRARIPASRGGVGVPTPLAMRTGHAEGRRHGAGGLRRMTRSNVLRRYDGSWLSSD